EIVQKIYKNCAKFCNSSLVETGSLFELLQILAHFLYIFCTIFVWRTFFLFFFYFFLFFFFFFFLFFFFFFFYFFFFFFYLFFLFSIRSFFIELINPRAEPATS